MIHKNKIFHAIGLMSGTSMDGIDLALIKSDGAKLIERKYFEYSAYEPKFKQQLHYIIHNKPTLSEIKETENLFTILNANMVNKFIKNNHLSRENIDLIAFHGHTIFHDPSKLITWQIGNSHLLAKETGIKVISDFRAKDVSHGGQGAPLVPIYHFYLLSQKNKPVAVLNIGGISNITHLQNDAESEIEAFDLCFGNAPLDDIVRERLGIDFDQNGEISRSGKINYEFAEMILSQEIFHKKPPKSFDRNDFAKNLIQMKSLETSDYLATLAYIHARAVEINLNFLSSKPKEIFICGGGRKNVGLIEALKKQLKEITIKTAEEINLNGDAIEAEAFAFLGIRSLMNLPISFHKTTGIRNEQNYHKSSLGGGIIFKP